MRRWNYNELQNAVGKTFKLSFLPYLELPSGDPVEKVIGYTPARVRRGYGYGTWEEFFRTLSDAQYRMTFLANSGAIEYAQIRKEVPGNRLGVLVDEWGED